MQKIKRELVHELAAKEIQNYIVEQDLKEGDKLPPLEKLSLIMGVGRSSLREALRYLEAMDIVELVNGKGVFVKDVNSYRFSTKVKVGDLKRTLLHVCEVRRALEGMAVELAASRASDESIEEMERYLSEIRLFTDMKKDTSKLDMHFHKTIYKAALNPVLESVVESTWKMFEHFWSHPFGIDTIFDDTLPFHFTMAEAIKNKDGKKAREEFNKLMDGVENAIRRVQEE
jgi:GntR family transcriptional repressor for pyruvate dehydrogenase complex